MSRVLEESLDDELSAIIERYLSEGLTKNQIRCAFESHEENLEYEIDKEIGEDFCRE